MRKTFPANHHFVELDSVRGLAAITVLIGHYLNLFLVKEGPYAGVGHGVELARKTPLFALFAGHESVMLFFVLSGFVLSLQFLKGRAVNFGSFAIKRIFRIYVPYLAALATALVACAFAYSGRIGELSEWFNTPWSKGITFSALAEHIAFLGSFKSDAFDPVLWSLVHELRISFLFPFLVAVLLRFGSMANIRLALALSFTGMTGTLALLKFKIDMDYLLTIHYIGMFIAGYLIAKNVNEIYGWHSKLKTWQKIGLGVTGFCLYTFSHQLPGRLNYFSDLPIALGAVLMVITAICSKRTSAFLRLKVVRFFGDISYSLYLFHAIMLLTCVHLLYGKLPIAAVLAIAGALSVLVSWLSYHFVELPAIRAGKAVSARYEARSTSAAPARA